MSLIAHNQGTTWSCLYSTLGDIVTCIFLLPAVQLPFGGFCAVGQVAMQGQHRLCGTLYPQQTVFNLLVEMAPLGVLEVAATTTNCCGVWGVELVTLPQQDYRRCKPPMQLYSQN